MQVQQEYVFFPQGTPAPTPEARRSYLDQTSPHSPYYGFIGNEKAVNKLKRIDFDMLGNYNHICRELSVAFVGKSGSGKTELAKRHCKANRLPTAEISPRAVRTLQDVYSIISRTCEVAGLPLVEQRPKYFKPGPMNVFIDEVHALPAPIVQGLLKAVEYKDCILATEKGVILDTYNIHWMIATTDRGRLFDAFDTRFTKVIVSLYTKEDITKIVQVTYKELPEDACRLVSHYCSRMPREALAFAREMLLEYNMQPGPWAGIASRVAEDNGIDSQGMTYQRLTILKALGQAPVAEKRLPSVIGVKPEEMERYILPWLVEATEDQAQLVGVCQKGYCITLAGLVELDKRLIPHKGASVAA